MRKSTTLIAAAGLAALGLAANAQTMEDWQLGHGDFVTASDVRAHNGLPQDRADMLTALGGDSPDWTAALNLYSSGRNFPWRDMTHSLGRFADDYNGAMPAVVPASVAHWGDPSFAARPVYSALAGTRGFQDEADAARIAFIEGATLATIINWTRFELAMSAQKALAAEPNWALSNGSPKNWNEIFAFHHGPDGRHSVHEALEAVPGGDRVNAALYAALAEGQEPLLEESWPAEAGADVDRLLHEGALRLLAAALRDVADAKDDSVRDAAMRARGLWLAAAEPVLAHSAEAVAVIEGALAVPHSRALLSSAMEEIEAVMHGLAG